MFRFMLPITVAAALVTTSQLMDIPSACAADDPAVQNVEPQAVEGMVVSAGTGQVSVRAADGKEHSFKPNEMTRITVNGKPGKLEDLKPGVMIRVMVDKQGKVISISTVDDRK